MKDKEKLKIYEDLLRKHNYPFCKICNEPIIGKEDKITIEKRWYEKGQYKNRVLHHFHKKCDPDKEEKPIHEKKR